MYFNFVSLSYPIRGFVADSIERMTSLGSGSVQRAFATDPIGREPRLQQDRWDPKKTDKFSYFAVEVSEPAA